MAGVHGGWLREGVEHLYDLEYARVGDRSMLLDLYFPESGATPRPLIIWVHGGAFRTGDRRDGCVAARMALRGYAVASVGYRLSHEALFPAQTHDCRAAVRWLRAHASAYGLDANRFGAWGPSAGGHLVAMLGVAGGHDVLEGDEGVTGYSSRVQAVCDWFGPTDFSRMNDYPGDMDHDAPDSPESELVGAPIQQRPDLVARANPITYITGAEPPFLIVHGDHDPLVPHDQSVRLYNALRSAGVEATLHTIAGAGHGTPEFYTSEITALVDAFFDRYLRS